MTKQDDALLNDDNPLMLKAKANNGLDPVFGKAPFRSYAQTDDNFLNLLRWAGKWTDRKHLKNELVTHRGGAWVAQQDTLLEPGGNVEWVEIRSPMARAGMNITAPKAKPDIGTPWQDLNEFDQETLLAFGMTVGLAGGTFSFEFPGLFHVNLATSIAHNSSNQGRALLLRLWDLTTGSQAGAEYRVGIGRNVEDTNATLSILTPVSTAALGHVFVFQYSSPDSITAVSFTSQRADFAQIHPS